MKDTQMQNVRMRQKHNTVQVLGTARTGTVSPSHRKELKLHRSRFWMYLRTSVGQFQQFYRSLRVSFDKTELRLPNEPD